MISGKQMSRGKEGAVAFLDLKKHKNRVSLICVTPRRKASVILASSLWVIALFVTNLTMGEERDQTSFKTQTNSESAYTAGASDGKAHGSPVKDIDQETLAVSGGDCNNNGIPDSQDILDGTSQDCNGNGIPDECDIADCPARLPECDDCNLNAVPDFCDIMNGTSEDLDFNNIPDECANFIGGCGPAIPEWSCPFNWNLDGFFPNNMPPFTFSVTLDNGDVAFLDPTIAVDTLRMLDNSQLIVNQAGPQGDLFLEQGQVRLNGALLIGNGRLIEAFPPAPMLPPLFQIGPGGVYRSAGATTSSNASRSAGPGMGDLVTGDLTIQYGETCPPDCPPADGGLLDLSGTMTLTVNGTLTVDGSLATTCSLPTLRGGVTPPPEVKIQGSAASAVTGEFEAFGWANLLCSSTENMEIGGDYNNRLTEPACFDWSGGITLDASLAVLRNAQVIQIFEVAGIDVGAVQAGFGNGNDTNFSMGNVEVSATSSVTFRNDFANTVGTTACDEALYVDTLTLRNGTTILLDDCRVYYNTLIDEGATIQTSGCGALVHVPECTQNVDCMDWVVCTEDWCDMSGLCQHDPILSLIYADVNKTGMVDVDDVLCVLAGFGGSFTDECPQERVDISPCGSTTGVVDVDDVLAVIAAFGGNFFCPDPCP